MTTKALKYDSGKPPLGLIPLSALNGEARVMAFGANKYGRDNWRKGMEWSRLIDAALRHITAFNEGEDTDPESGLSHLGHARCCLAFLSEYADKQLGVDDRAAAGRVAELLSRVSEVDGAGTQIAPTAPESSDTGVRLEE